MAKSIADSSSLYLKPSTGQSADILRVTDSSGDIQIKVTAAGGIIMANLPTSNPSVAGQLYSNSNVVTLGTT